MKRNHWRIFILIFLLLPATTCWSSSRSPCIIVVETMPVPVVLEHSQSFQDALASFGYINGKNARIEVLKAEGNREKAMELLQGAIDREKPDLVATVATLATQAACQLLEGTQIPLLFFVVSDPVGAGIIEKVGVPTGTNVTGRVFTVFRETKVDLTLQLVRQRITDRPVRFGIVHTSYPSAQGDVAALRAIAGQRRDVEFIPFEIQYQEMSTGTPAMLADTLQGLKSLENRVDFWWQSSGPLAEIQELTDLQLGNSQHAIGYGNTLKSVQMGGLLTINPNFQKGGIEAAKLARDILQGADPGSIPVTAPDTFDLGVNLKTALQLGLVIPSNMMDMAGEHVYH